MIFTIKDIKTIILYDESQSQPYNNLLQNFIHVEMNSCKIKSFDIFIDHVRLPPYLCVDAKNGYYILSKFNNIKEMIVDNIRQNSNFIFNLDHEDLKAKLTSETILTEICFFNQGIDIALKSQYETQRSQNKTIYASRSISPDIYHICLNDVNIIIDEVLKIINLLKNITK